MSKVAGVRGVLMGVAIIFSVSLAVSAQGPAGTKKYDPSYLRENIVEGKTTASEIERMLGKPTSKNGSTGRSGSTEEWLYERSEDGINGKIDKARSKLADIGGALGWRGGLGKANDASYEVLGAQNRANNAQRALGAGVSRNDGSLNRLRITFEDGVVREYELKT